MEGCGWLDYNHRPIKSWQAVLARIREKWEADGRPSQTIFAEKAGHKSATGVRRVERSARLFTPRRQRMVTMRSQIQKQTATRKRAAKQWPQFRKVTFDGIHYEIVRVVPNPKGATMNEPKPIALDIPSALKSLAGITALLEALASQNKQQSEPVSIIEPQSPTARFNSAASSAHTALKALIATIDNLLAAAPINNQLSNLLNVMRQDAERFQKNLEVNTLDISGEIRGFDNIQPKPPDEDCPGEEWRHP